MTTEILLYAANFREQISRLRLMAPIYPDVHFEEDERYIWATTMVKFSYNGAVYKRHHVESAVINTGIDATALRRRLDAAAEMCIKLAVPCFLDEIVDANSVSHNNKQQ